MSSATSWNSELPSGRNPFWIKDEALADLGLHVGDAVSVDTRREPEEGELTLLEVETDELSDRLVRRFRWRRWYRSHGSLRDLEHSQECQE